MAETVLVIDDDTQTIDVVQEVLREDGYNVAVCSDAKQALTIFKQTNPDVVLLDIMMPGLDGISICLQIREISDVPVIFLSAKGQPTDKAIGLRLGADDYLGKPFDIDELSARVRAVLRRSHAAAANEPAQRLQYGNLRIDLVKHEVDINGEPVSLTPVEYKLLVKLASQPNQLFTRDQLVKDVWEYNFMGKTRTVDVHIRRLRKKLEDAGGPVDYVTTVRGFGYRFSPAPEAASRAS